SSDVCSSDLVDNGAQNRRHPPDPPSVRQLVPQQVGEHIVESHHRHTQDQHDPKQAPELSHMIPVPGMAPMVFVTGVVLTGLTMVTTVIGVIVVVDSMVVRMLFMVLVRQ